MAKTHTAEHDRPRGYALHIALDAVDEQVYGTRAMLNICENDARIYADIAKQEGFETPVYLFGSEATGSRFNQEIERLSRTLKTGDYFLLTFSGHGSKIPDLDGDEEGGYDQAWCFYDGYVPDDHLYSLWPQFAAGVRIFVISDSCHSGDMLRNLFNIDPFSIKAEAQPLSATISRGIRTDPFSTPAIRCSIQLLSAAKKDRYAEGGREHSLFTQALLKVWDEGGFLGSHDDFYRAISLVLPETKAPGRMALGQPPFNHQRPFTI